MDITDTNIKIIFCQPSYESFYIYYINSLNKRNTIDKHELYQYLIKIVPELYADIDYLLKRYKEFYIIPETKTIKELIPDKSMYKQEKIEMVQNILQQKIFETEKKSEKQQIKKKHHNIFNKIFKNKTSPS
jgi:hypothetical protein